LVAHRLDTPRRQQGVGVAGGLAGGVEGLLVDLVVPPDNEQDGGEHRREPGVAGGILPRVEALDLAGGGQGVGAGGMTAGVEGLPIDLVVPADGE
jgi:hypothetical protein